jgi:hypothetical protein
MYFVDFPPPADGLFALWPEFSSWRGATLLIVQNSKLASFPRKQLFFSSPHPIPN